MAVDLRVFEKFRLGDTLGGIMIDEKRRCMISKNSGEILDLMKAQAGEHRMTNRIDVASILMSVILSVGTGTEKPRDFYLYISDALKAISDKTDKELGELFEYEYERK